MKFIMEIEENQNVMRRKKHPGLLTGDNVIQKRAYILLKFNQEILTYLQTNQILLRGVKTKNVPGSHFPKL